MVRFVGIDLPRKKKIVYALTYIHGIGLTSATKIIELAKINPDTRTENLTTDEIIVIRDILEQMNLKLEGDLRRFNGLNVKRLIEINCFRGKRHRTSLPVRGQRTRTNARTRRGGKKTVSGKKK
uniref:Small ribosomal subunit protein uS13c n=1 Tax=Actinocyclus sp. (in: diatoms) TaxID=1923973 RepID=A0A9E9BR27_9STRA|nr:ribosomal protein S13 [Actinocyclus sp. (in: diatoms)]